MSGTPKTPPPSESLDFETLFGDKHVDGWRVYLAAWDARMWPVFQAQGFTRSEAFICSLLLRIDNSLENISEKLDDE